MPLTPDVFRQLESDWSVRQQIAIRAAVGSGRRGILPPTGNGATDAEQTTVLNGTFVRRTYEMTGLKCAALLPSGRILVADGDYVLPIDIPAGSSETEYYVTLELSPDQVHTYRRQGIPYTTPACTMALRTLSEVKRMDVMPVKRFIIDQGSLNVDEGYIPPILNVSSAPQLQSMLSNIAQMLKDIAQHKNMDENECKRTLLHFSFLIDSFDICRPTGSMIEMLQEGAMAVKYHIFKLLITDKEAEHFHKAMSLADDERQKPDDVNIMCFIDWLTSFLCACRDMMEVVRIPDPLLDIEALKKEIHDSVYAELYDEISGKLRQQLTDELTPAITESLAAKMTEMLEQTKPELRQQLHDDLRDPLYNDIYDALLDALKKLLDKPKEEIIDNFTPLI